VSKVAVIPARGGSKGIPRKNLVDLCGKPLIAYTIEAAKKSELFSQIIVNSDDPEILAVAERHGVETYQRSAHLAKDSTTTDEVLHDFLISQPHDTHFCLLQPTSPLRTALHICQSYDLFTQLQCQNMVASVTAQDPSLLKLLTVDENGLLSGVYSDDAPFLPRQTLPIPYAMNGAIYWFSHRLFSAQTHLPRTQIKGYVMDKTSSVDVDSMVDLESVKAYLCAEH
jgi:N-acylneuraminate cytidylyltransferase